MPYVEVKKQTPERALQKLKQQMGIR